MKKDTDELKKGLIEYAVLLVISKGPVYSGTILQKLKEADFITVEGTLYPLLSRLKNQSYLSYYWEESKSGPPRKYYSLTKEGLEILKDYDVSWNNLVSSINILNK